jgi:subtilase family serine protease
MHRTRKIAAVAGAATVVAAMAAAANGPALASPRQGPVPLPGSAVPFAAHTMVTGEVASSQRLTIQLWLRPRLAAAASFATAVSTPGNAQFHHYLSPRGYTAQFGPGSSEARRVASWLHGQGFASIHTDSQRDYVRATASVATIDAAFAVRLEY